jgi:hypothetical protein
MLILPILFEFQILIKNPHSLISVLHYIQSSFNTLLRHHDQTKKQIKHTYPLKKRYQHE